MMYHGDPSAPKTVSYMDCTTGHVITRSFYPDGLRSFREALFKRGAFSTATSLCLDDLYDEAVKLIQDTRRWMAWTLTEPSIFGDLTSTCVLDYIDVLESSDIIRKAARRILNVIKKRHGYACVCMSNNDSLIVWAIEVADKLKARK